MWTSRTASLRSESPLWGREWRRLGGGEWRRRSGKGKMPRAREWVRSEDIRRLISHTLLELKYSQGRNFRELYLWILRWKSRSYWFRPNFHPLSISWNIFSRRKFSKKIITLVEVRTFFKKLESSVIFNRYERMCKWETEVSVFDTR